MLLTMLSSLLMLSFSSCSIQGEEVCGIWNAKGEYGEMKLEIAPWRGTFYAYLLEYNSVNETIVGAKEDAFVFLTDLSFEDLSYKNGKIYFDQNSENSCGVSLKIIDANQLKATYDCDGKISEEIWTRDGYMLPLVEPGTVQELRIDTIQEPDSEAGAIQESEASTVQVQKMQTLQQDDDAKSRSTFYVIGVHQTVAYGNMDALTKTVESLWNKIYYEDFSEKLNNIINKQDMFVVYSDYDNPKGKMTVTIGYSVNDLSTIPLELKGIKIPSNNYYVYPLSGNASDFEGEGWDQMEELATYRSANSVDFEVYTFDNNYEIGNAEIWIASQ